MSDLPAAGSGMWRFQERVNHPDSEIPMPYYVFYNIQAPANKRKYAIPVKMFWGAVQ